MSLYLADIHQAATALMRWLLLRNDGNSTFVSHLILSRTVRIKLRQHVQRGQLSTPKQALTKDPLEAMLATCSDGLIGIRDRALLLFAWASGDRRCSEVTRAVMEQLIAIDAAPLAEYVVYPDVPRTPRARFRVLFLRSGSLVALTGRLRTGRGWRPIFGYGGVYPDNLVEFDN
jgi:integrase